MNIINSHKPGYKHTPLGWIPEDWQILPLVELSNDGIKNGVFNDPSKVGTGYRLINVINLYTEPCIDTSAVSRLNISKKEFKKVNKGDLFFTRSSIKLEGIAHCNINIEDAEDITYDGHIMKLSPKLAVIQPMYLRLYCVSSKSRKFFMARAKFNTMTTIGQEDIAGLPVLIPTKLEQIKIINVISAWDSAISQAQQLVAQLKQRNKGLMQQLLTGQKRLSCFNDNWTRVHIYDLANEVSLKNKANKALTVLSCTKYNGLVDSLTYFGRRIFSEDISTYKVVPKEHFAYATNHIEEGSIGYQSAYDNALISPMYTVFKTNDTVNDAYLFKLLKSHSYIHQYQKRMEGSIDRRGGLRWEEFSKIAVHLPSYEEQTAINKLLDNAIAEVKLQEAHLNALQQQKRGLMQKLLTGEIRVKIN